MLEHTLSTYCNSQTAEQETWKETEQEELKVCLTTCAHSYQPQCELQGAVEGLQQGINVPNVC